MVTKSLCRFSFSISQGPIKKGDAYLLLQTEGGLIRGIGYTDVPRSKEQKGGTQLTRGQELSEAATTPEAGGQK